MRSKPSNPRLKTTKTQNILPARLYVFMTHVKRECGLTREPDVTWLNPFSVNDLKAFGSTLETNVYCWEYSKLHAVYGFWITTQMRGLAYRAFAVQWQMVLPDPGSNICPVVWSVLPSVAGKQTPNKASQILHCVCKCDIHRIRTLWYSYFYSFAWSSHFFV